MTFTMFIRKGVLVGVLFFIVLTACRESSAWAYQAEPRRGMKAAELSYEPERMPTDMQLQMLKTEGRLTALLSIFVGRFAVDEDNNVTIHVRSTELREAYPAHCMEGGQRCLLPEAAVQCITEQLSRGNEVILHTKQQIVKLHPVGFKKLYKKLCNSDVSCIESTRGETMAIGGIQSDGMNPYYSSQRKTAPILGLCVLREHP